MTYPITYARIIQELNFSLNCSLSNAYREELMGTVQTILDEFDLNADDLSMINKVLYGSKFLNSSQNIEILTATLNSIPDTERSFCESES